MATTIRVPISILAPAVSANGGNAFFSVAGLTAQDYGHWEFVKSVQGNLFGQVAVPHNLNATPNAKIILSFAANAATGNTVIQIGTARIPAGTSINPGQPDDRNGSDDHRTGHGVPALRRDSPGVGYSRGHPAGRRYSARRDHA